MTENATDVPLSQVANPYDFSNPVSKKGLFIGRKKELDDIKYYLNHAKSADRAINIALLGERAAGKTSLLNIIEIESKERELVPVRINLNESDVEHHFAFWFKLFDTVLNRVVLEPNSTGDGEVFGGQNGRTYDTYLDLTSAYDIPEDKTFCPFLFPVRYAKAMDAGKANARISDQIIERDLRCIAEEVGRPIVLLIDECNILSSQRALLEMVRNTFMNLPGYMLVFTGTPDLFPLMDEVFSPIVRQFKRIEVTPFAHIRETHRAVTEPLKLSGHEQLLSSVPTDLFETFPEEISDDYGSHDYLYPSGYLADVHTLTNGRPYEIQLVCHFMFKRVQFGQDKRMRLSIEVLEDVLRELKQSHGDDNRPIISAVKSLDESDLTRLQVLLRSCGRTPLKQLFWVYGLFEDFPEDEYWAADRRLVERGILGETDGCAVFRGDDFDRIVCKYAAKQRNINLSFDWKPLRVMIRSKQLRAISDAIGDDARSKLRVRPLHHPFQDSLAEDFLGHWNELSRISLRELCERLPKFATANYRFFVQNSWALANGLAIYKIDVSGPDFNLSNCFMIPGPSPDDRERIDLMLRESARRASLLRGKLEFSSVLFEHATLEDCCGGVAESGDKEALTSCLDVHVHRMVDAHLEERNREESLKQALFVSSYDASGLSQDDQNNIGYVLLINGKIAEAVKLLESAITDDGVHSALAQYNLGIAYLLQLRPRDAAKLLAACIKNDNKKRVSNIAALLQVKEHRGDLKLDEVVCQDDVINEEDGPALSLAQSAERAREIAVRRAGEIMDEA